MPTPPLSSLDELTTNISSSSLSTLLKVSGTLASTLELSEVLQIAIESAVNLIGVDSGAIYTLENNFLYLGATTPSLPEEFPEELRKANLSDHPHIGKAISTHKPVSIDDAKQVSLTAEEKNVVDSRQLDSLLYFPLLLKEQAIGAFILGSINKIHYFSPHEIHLANILSYQVSLAIANAKLFQETQHSLKVVNRAYTETLEGWSKMLDLRDHVTDAHTHRVVELTINLAEKIGIPESELENIKRGALLHDIGKMGIPDTILQKKGPLTEDEFSVMKTHPESAYQILSKIDYLIEALDIPYYHHEKWDGTGYPRQLMGEEIPIAARLFAVVDVYDALTSDRPYRKAWKKEDAIQYIQSQSGKHFDPAVVEVFVGLIAD